jgi:hypothetical protein
MRQLAPVVSTLGGGLPLLAPLASPQVPWAAAAGLVALAWILLAACRVVDRVLTYRMYLAALDKVRSGATLRDLATVVEAGRLGAADHEPTPRVHR